MITGLQAHALIAGLTRYPWSQLALSGAVISAVVIVSRFVWMYPATYLPRLLIPAVARRDPSPPWQWPFALAFTGIRGIRLAGRRPGHSCPHHPGRALPFPHRDLILFVTFVVILVTLVGQGLALPSVVKALGLVGAGRRERHDDRLKEFKARRRAVEAAIERLDQLAKERQLPRNPRGRSERGTATG